MIVEDRSSQRALAIVARYEQAVNYLYPMRLNMNPKRRVLRDETLRALSGQDRINFLAAWRDHAQWADSHNLMRAMEI